MIQRSFLAAWVMTVLSCCFCSVAALAQQPVSGYQQLSLENVPWKGDFGQMLERRKIRVLVPYSRTLYFMDKGSERGLTAELVREFERYLNRKHAKQLGKRPLTVYMIATPRDKLLSGLVEGTGDIAAGNITATDRRRKTVDFIAPTDRKSVQELIITGPASPAVGVLDDLSGKTIHVRKAASYYDSVLSLNARLRKAGKAPAKMVLLPDALEDEDELEMLNSGLFEFIVVDDWKAHLWARVLPHIKVREDLVLRSEGFTGWAVRHDSPQVITAVHDFYRNVVKKQGTVEVLLARYYRQIRQISNNTSGPGWQRFEQTIKLFEKYGRQYGFDPLMLAAQGYQESGLRQDVRGSSGAIGIMQLMPETGHELKVGDIHQIGPNIHGGAKYMSHLMTRYFPDANFAEDVRPLFAFASYNAGPGSIAKMREEAAKRGLDPDKWFNNVEIVVADHIGLETTTYVRNIYKYYTAYKLVQEARIVRRKAREKLMPVKPG